MNEKEWKEYQHIEFELMGQYIEATILPFEVIQKMTLSELIFTGQLILFIGIQKAVNPDSWPEGFSIEIMYAIHGFILMNLSSEDKEGFDRIFKKCSTTERFKLWCLWITQERIRMILGQRIEDAEFGKAYIEHTKSPEDQKLILEYRDRLAELIQKPKALVNALKKSKRFERLTVLERPIEFVRSPEDILNDVEKRLLEIFGKTPSGFKVFRDLFLFTKFLKSQVTPQRDHIQLTENKRWLNESLFYFDEGFERLYETYYPMLEMNELAPNLVKEDFQKKDSAFQEIKRHEKHIDLGITHEAKQVFDDSGYKKTEQETYRKEDKIYYKLYQGGIPPQERIAHPIIDNFWAAKRLMKIIPISETKNPNKPEDIQFWNDAVKKKRLERAIRCVVRTPVEAKELTKAIRKRANGESWTKISKKINFSRQRLPRKIKEIKRHIQNTIN
jgi:hypothetical protein